MQTYVNWGSLTDDDPPSETAPLGEGPVAPIPTYSNPNE